MAKTKVPLILECNCVIHLMLSSLSCTSYHFCRFHFFLFQIFFHSLFLCSIILLSRRNVGTKNPWNNENISQIEFAGRSKATPQCFILLLQVYIFFFSHFMTTLHCIRRNTITIWMVNWLYRSLHASWIVDRIKCSIGRSKCNYTNSKSWSFIPIKKEGDNWRDWITLMFIKVTFISSTTVSYRFSNDNEK